MFSLPNFAVSRVHQRRSARPAAPECLVKRLGSFMETPYWFVTDSWPRRAVVFFLTLMAASSALAADVVIFPVRGTNLSQGEQAAIGNLLAASYAAQSGKSVLGPNEAQRSLAQTESERDSARALGALEYVDLEAIRLDVKIALHATLRNQYGSELYQVRTTALSLDDMDVVADRIAAALIRRTDIVYTRNIDNVTGKESRQANRLFLEKILGPRCAFVMPFGKGVDETTGLALGFNARLEQADYFLEVGLALLFQNIDHDGPDLSGMIGQIGASYYLMHSSVSPYVGIGVSPRLLIGSSGGAGLAVNAHAGLMFMRESSTRIYVELQLDQNLIERAREIRYDYPTNASRSSGFPTEFSLAAGIGF
jgi:hypothetical protein